MVTNEDNGLGTPDLRHYFGVLRAYWRGILGIILIAILIAFLWTLTQPKVYASTASGLMVASGSANIGTALAAENLAKAKASSYQNIANTRLVADRVKDELKLDVNVDSLLGTATAVIPAGTAQIQITVESDDPAQSQSLANAWINALADQIYDMETAGSEGENPVSVVQLTPLGTAALPGSPVSPNTKLALALGGVFGIALALGYALVRNHLDRRVRSAEALEQLGLAVVGTIPLDQRLERQRALVETGEIEHANRAAHAYSEALRELRTNLTYVDVDNPPRIIVVTSPVPGEGKSSVAANLAIAIATTGQRTVLVDADLRRPVLTTLFQLPGGAGLTELLGHQVDLDDVLQPYGPVPQLSVLGAGRIPPNPSEMLGSQAMRALLQELSREAIVLIDAPPLLPVTDAAVISKAADGVLITVKASSTTVDEAKKALDNLRKVDAKILGAILNQVPTKGAQAAQYGYYGQYYASKNTLDTQNASKVSVPVVPDEIIDEVQTEYPIEPELQTTSNSVVTRAAARRMRRE